MNSKATDTFKTAVEKKDSRSKTGGIEMILRAMASYSYIVGFIS